MNLQKISPDMDNYDNYWFSKDNKEIYFEKIISHKDKDILGHSLKSRELYYYNIETSVFAKFDELQNVFDNIQSEFKL